VELNAEGVAIGDYQKFCGAAVPPAFISQNNRVQVKFRSNRNVNDVGFALNFTAGTSSPSSVEEYYVQAGRRLDSAPSTNVVAMATKIGPTCKSLCAQIACCCRHTRVHTGLLEGSTSQQGPIKFWGVYFGR